MKKNILYSTFVAFTCLFFAACSNDDNLEQIDFNNLKFVVNVSTDDNNSSIHKVKSKANSKIGWSNNDCIFMSADGSATNIYKLTFNGKDWNVEKADEAAKFSNSSGKVNAVFSNKSSYKDAGEVLVEGDILYTDEGTYKIEDNVVFINLNMSKRPVARIEIKGVGEGFWIEELTNYSGVNVSNLSLIENEAHYTGQKEDGGGMVYYGVLPKDADGNFTLTLTNKEGLSYQRTYKDKSLSAGDHIVINGPVSTEANDWYIVLKGIQAVKSDISIGIGTVSSISELYVLVPENATSKEVKVTSSDPSVVKINEDGTYSAVGIGNAVITIKTKDDKYSCQIQIQVKAIEVNGIRPVESKINLAVGSTGKISGLYIIEPENATNKEVEVTSSDPSVVKINEDGTYTTLKLGSAIITVKTKDGNHSCQIEIAVEDIPFFISATSIGGSIISIGGVIQRNSILNWTFTNNSNTTVRLKTLQLIDGQTGNEGNQMSVDADVDAKSSVSYSTTIGLFGIHAPVTCRFRYEYNNKEYYVDAIFN